MFPKMRGTHYYSFTFSGSDQCVSLEVLLPILYTFMFPFCKHKVNLLFSASGVMTDVSGVFVSAAKTKCAQRTWMPTAEKTTVQISAATTVTVSAAPVNARSGTILQRSTVACTVSATTSTVTGPTTSSAEVRNVQMK